MNEPVDLLVVHAGELLTCSGPETGVCGAALERLPSILDGAIAVREGRIAAVGSTAELLSRFAPDAIVDAGGKLVTPGLVDPHSHLVHGGTRQHELEARALGMKPPLAGGIRYTVQQTRAASDGELVERALADLDIALRYGTTTIEAKTGYGLDAENELRLLRLTVSLRHPVAVVPTFLGAHVVPAEYAERREAYVDLVLEMLPDAARLAPWCDVACDPVCFTYEECWRIAERAAALGMGLRIHADQTGDAGGARLAAAVGAAAADHLDYASDDGLLAMAEAGTVATLLPSVTLHLMEMTPSLDGERLGAAAKPFMPALARRVLRSGLVPALSADYNPGSSPTLSMQLVMQLAARLFRLRYAEIWHMATINAARALRLSHDRGSIEPGKRADILIWTVPDHGTVIDRFGTNLVDTVLIGGEAMIAGGVPVRDRRGETRAPRNHS